MSRNTVEVFYRFLALGCVSFGGPAAHLGYFHKAFVQKLQWLDEAGYARLIALSQFLPGPGSSQVGFALGLRRAGLLGGVAAFVGFTLPSFVLLYLLAVGVFDYASGSTFDGVIQGLKLFAVVVVADASYSMFKSFCSEKRAITIAVVTAVTLLIIPSLITQMLVLLLAAAVGIFIGKQSTAHTAHGKISYLPLVLFFLLLLGLPFIAGYSQWLGMANDFYYSGSFVFGGGHVVLPLLQQTLGDTVATDRFLLGYAAAQAVPGPMFTLATFLGAEMSPVAPWIGAFVATLAIFLPGFLLVLGLQDSWESLAAKPRISGAVWGINAAVVGLLISALYQPVFVSAVDSSLAMAAAITGFFALRSLKLPILLLILAFALFGVVT
ncbi:MAG: chromate efflux transporter [Candidatus Sedimenticola sp. 6PFRAG1]